MTPKERHDLFDRGWKDGACAVAATREDLDEDDYQRGWKRGWAARCEALLACARLVGFADYIKQARLRK